MGGMRGASRTLSRLILVIGAAAVVSIVSAPITTAQPVPKPFPRAGEPPNQQGQKPPAATPTVTAPAPGGVPTEATLGLPLYPAAQYLASYDAGRGQRYFIFGTTAAFGEVVAFYKNVLRQKGELVFEQPPTQMFEVGRFREDSMAFPPGITVKDYSWMPEGGYRNPKPGTQPERFPTVIQVVPLSGPGGQGEGADPARF